MEIDGELSINNVTATMVMGRCTGEPTHATGSCVYETPKQGLLFYRCCQ